MHTVSAPTHYQILGVDSTATTGQIRQAYRAKARALHPDVSKASDAAEKFAEIARAYEVLSDRRRRTDYDASLSTPRRSGSRAGRPAAAAEPHYTWTNIATEESRSSEPSTPDFDEMYDAYFGTHRPAE